MTKNIGRIDKIARLLIGAVVTGISVYFENILGLIVAVLIVVTALIEVCPAYFPFKFSTCKIDEKENPSTGNK